MFRYLWYFVLRIREHVHCNIAVIVVLKTNKRIYRCPVATGGMQMLLDPSYVSST